MAIKTLVSTLSAITLMGTLAPHAAAVSITDNDLTLSIGVQLQSRVDFDKAKDGNGNDYSPDSGADFTKAPTASIYMRRARFSFKGTYMQDWGFNFTFRDDGAGRGGTNSTSAGETPLMQQAYISRIWKMEGVSSQIQVGQDYAFHNRSNNVVSSSELLFPTLSATAALLNSRAPGVGYRFNSDMVTFGADFQNNTTHTGGVAGTAAAPDKAEGLFYSARVELTGPGSWRIAKDTESFVGAQGMGARIGLDIADNKNSRTGGPPPTNSRSTLDYGIDGLFHWDGLSALAEARWDNAKNTADTGTSAPNTKSVVFDVQAGYCIPMSGWAIEPAVRYERMDFKNTGAGADLFGANNQDDYGNSGKQIEVGVNLYWAGHKCKTQIEYVNWKGLYGGTAAGTATADKAKASIFRLQQQLVF